MLKSSPRNLPCPACGRVHDLLYAEPLTAVEGFQFDESVAHVFPDMIERSVPGYNTILHMIGVFTQRFVQRESRCYDLGCSLGAVTRSMRRNINHGGCRIVAVDNSMAMLERCRAILEKDDSLVPVDMVCADIQDVAIVNASVVVLNFTLQFIPLCARSALLCRIHEGLLPGGVLVLSEKIRFTDSGQQAFQTEMHHAFKKSMGYSELEISQKRAALERVLLPESLEEHGARLSMAGFRNHHTWFQCFNFVSFVARK